MLEDKLLIWKFKRGSSEALCRIYQKYGDYLLALAAALLQDVNAAEDVLHDVFCKFIESKEKINRLVSFHFCSFNRVNESLGIRTY